MLFTTSVSSWLNVNSARPAAPVSHLRVCSSLPPASLRGSPRSAGRSYPGSLQITASALALRVCEDLHGSFMSGVLFPIALYALLKISPAGPQNQIFQGLIFPVHEPLGWGAQCGLRSHESLQEEPLRLYQYLSSHLRITLSREVWVLTNLYHCPSYLSFCAFFCIPLVVEDLFC